MDMHELQEGLGGTGKFGELFVGLGLIGIVGGGLLCVMGAFMMWPEGNTGEAVHIDSLQSGMLFLVMGVGFVLFAVMIMLAGWARHHPGFDEHHKGIFHEGTDDE